MTSEMTAIGIAICTTSLVCLLLIKWSPKRPGNRQASYDNSGSDGGTYGDDSGILFGGDGHHSASDHSAGASDSSASGDSGGGDGGGGDGGGGGD